MVSNARRRTRTAALVALAAAASLLAGCSADLDDLNEGIDSLTANSPRETRIAPDHWRLVIGAFTEKPDVRLLYRAAVHAKAAGYSHFQIVDYSDSGSTSLDALGVNDPAAPLNCMADGLARAHCATWSADDVLATRGHMLGKSKTMIDDEVEIARIQEPRRAQ